MKTLTIDHKNGHFSKYQLIEDGRDLPIAYHEETPSELIEQLESYLECWKQFNRFVNLARGRKFKPEDEDQFLEIKSIIIQELEFILSSIEVASPTRDEVHALIGGAPSLRFLAEMQEGALRNLESQWHKIYIGWHSILGQLKVKLTAEQTKSMFSSLAGDRKK